MSDERKYVRVYYQIIDDDRFAHVYSDDAALAAWLRMLLDADALWPASASLPRSLPRRVLQVLTESGLIEVSGSRLRVHGLDAERQRRSDVGRAGGLASGRSRSNDRSTNVQRTSNERRTTTTNENEPSRAETSRRAGPPIKTTGGVTWRRSSPFAYASRRQPSGHSWTPTSRYSTRPARSVPPS